MMKKMDNGKKKGIRYMESGSFLVRFALSPCLRMLHLLHCISYCPVVVNPRYLCFPLICVVL